MHLPSSSRASVCAHCGAAKVTSASALWRLAIVPAWATVGLMVLGAGMVGPFVLFLIPPLLFGGASLLSLVHGRASAPAECEACGKIATPSHPDARVAAIVHAPAGVAAARHAARAA